MSKKEIFRNTARKVVESLEATGKRPTVREIMKATGACRGHSKKILETATSYRRRKEVDLLISQLNTGNIPGLEPVCSLEDISRQKAVE
jgi:hypothetical protein